MRNVGRCVFGGISAAAVALFALPLLAGHTKLTENWKDVSKAMDEAKQTPGNAVAAAEADTKGKAVSVTAAVKDKNVVFSVHTVAGDKCQIVTVDKTGKVTEKKDPSAGACVGCADTLKAMDSGKYTLSAAIKSAEEYSKGKCIGASAETTAKDGTQVTVACAVGDKMQIVTVDGKTGKATKMEEDKGEKPPIKGG